MEHPETDQPEVKPRRKSRSDITGGLILILVGVLFLLRNVLPDFRFSDYWPLIIVAVGVGMLWKARAQ